MATMGGIPIVSATPILGSLLDFKNNRLALLERISKECGDIGWVKMGPLPPMLFLNSAENAYAVYAEQADRFIKYKKFVSICKPTLGNGLFTSEHEFHRRQRKLIAPAFAPRRIKEYAQEMVKLGKEYLAEWNDGEQIDVAAAMTQLSIAIVGRTLFGAQTKEDASVIRQALADAQRGFNEAFSYASAIHIPGFWSTPGKRRRRRAIADIDKVIYRIISERRALREDRGDVLSMLLAATDETDGLGMTDDQLHDEVITLFVTGHETTANALAFTCYALAKHPDVYIKVREEVDTILAGRAPTVEDLPTLPYTLQVIKESMRLYPPAYMDGHEPEQPVRLGEHELQIGTPTWVNIFAIHRRADYFPDPLRFDPDRFAPASEQRMKKFSYIPFGGGPRICIGSHFSTTQQHLLIAMFAQNVVFEMTSSAPLEFEPMVVLRPKRMPMRVRRRAQSEKVG